MDGEFFSEIIDYIKAMENIDSIIWIKYKKILNRLLYILNSYGEDYTCVSEEENFNNEENNFDNNTINLLYDEKRYSLCNSSSFFL